MLSDDDDDDDDDDNGDGNDEEDTFGLDNDITLDLENDMDLDTLSHTTHPHAQVLAQPRAIPAQLIARLLHEHFTQTDTRVTKEAMDVLCKYVEVFAQEAIARACFGKDEGGVNSVGGERGMEGDFLEVSVE